MLPDIFRRLPIAHRALHDLGAGRPENSRAAIRAAVDAGYGIEIDLQLSADGQAMVFHDYVLDRLTEDTGSVRALSAAELAQIPLKGGDGEGIPTLSEILDLVAGRVPLLIELKDQDGAMGPEVGTLEAATVAALAGYRGDVALMSFNPYSVETLAALAPDVPRGLTTSAYDPSVWTPLTAERCEALRAIPDFDRTGAAFISHERADAGRDRVQELRAAGVPVLSWTIRSPEEEAEVRKFVDNVTFEGYAAPLPA